jgi:hypothetical protein
MWSDEVAAAAPRACSGNLLVLRDGRVGFIDFGIVGRVSPITWGAVEALLLATQARLPAFLFLQHRSPVVLQPC